MSVLSATISIANTNRGNRANSSAAESPPQETLCHQRLFRTLSDRGDGGSNSSQVNLSRDLASGSLLGAVAGDVASLAALVAGLASSVERAAVGGGTVTGDVAELAAGVALHGLSLAVTGKVVGSTALVAGGRTGTASGESTTAAETTTVSTAGDGSTAADTDTGRAGASTGQVARLAAVVATAAGSGTGQAEGRAVGLDVAKTLAVVALLSLGGTRERALVGLVACSDKTLSANIPCTHLIRCK
ncbi:hypothetical protein BX600DRAFT_155560 [Xylariales sp. PMI_506]|nr:hypothetical protein BX600DRAFT_155560 [Xylariales sp. PMI_506]